VSRCIQKLPKFRIMMANTQGKAAFLIETDSIKIPHKTHMIILSIMFISRERKIFWCREATGGKQWLPISNF
jgi:hypothetical protein